MTCLKRGSLFLLILFGNSQAAEIDPKAILHQADRARGNVTGIIWPISLQTLGWRKNKTMELEVRGRGFDIHGKTLAPARSKGNLLLMVKGNMWFYKPGLSKPVPISRRQKLMGDAAYGDIAATNYAEDYDVLNVESQMLENVPCYVFQLRSANKKTTYDSIKYWVEKERLLGIRAEYMTVSGKLFKTATMQYEQQVQQEDEQRPFLSSIRIQNELIDQHITWLRFGAAEIRPLPDAIFNLNLLRK
jgi:hypothetical protein